MPSEERVAAGAGILQTKQSLIGFQDNMMNCFKMTSPKSYQLSYKTWTVQQQQTIPSGELQKLLIKL